MKPIYLILAVVLLAPGFATSLVGQTSLSKEETKYWKTKAKEYRRNLPALKALVESRDAAEEQVVDLQQEANGLRTELSLKDRQIAGYEEQLTILNQQLLDLDSPLPPVEDPTPPPSNPTTTVVSPGTSPSVSGTVFRVQIAALGKNKIDRTLATGNSMVLLEARDGLQKVMVGEFRTYTNARTLRNHLRKIGVRDAFIQAFQDGQPIDVRTAAQYTGETVED